MDINYLMDAGKVQRYHSAPGIPGNQTVADHTWGVMALLFWMWPEERKEVYIAAMFHDSEEGDLGDIPAPTKWGNRALKEELDNVEDKIRHSRGIPTPDLTDIEHAKIRFCDHFELMFYCYRETKMGNRYAIKPFRLVQPFMEENLEIIGEPCEEARLLIDHMSVDVYKLGDET
jgi:5'-deoxynucleotidase YfbR-like HD superfamily hydrolase